MNTEIAIQCTNVKIAEYIECLFAVSKKTFYIRNHFLMARDIVPLPENNQTQIIDPLLAVH